MKPFVPLSYAVPAKLEHDAFILRMLSIDDVVKDYDAVMASAEHIREVFGPGNTWPVGLTLEQNTIDLGWHQKEFQLRRSFAYTVMSPDESICLGCVYVDPTTKQGYDAVVTCWTRSSAHERGLDDTLFHTVKNWIAAEWPFAAVAFPGRDISWEAWEGIAQESSMTFSQLESITSRPHPFEYYTASELWTDAHTSEQMLAYHLNSEVDLSSRNAAFIDRSVEWIRTHFNVSKETSIADFGCGPGLYASRLARTGAAVTGIDFSPRSIAYAKDVAERDGLSIHYVNENYLEFDTEERFDLIIMIMCDFCALSPEQRATMLKSFHRFLKPDGAVLLDVYSLSAFAKREELSIVEKNLHYGFWSADPYYGFQQSFKYDDEKVVLDKYTLVEEGRTRTVYNWLQYFSPESLINEFAAQGFTVDEQFAGVAGGEYDPDGEEFAVVARKHTIE